MDNKIVSVEWGIERIPLKVPYVLSFTTVREIASVWVRFTGDDGRVGSGEAVPLPGYSDETEETACAELFSLAPRFRGLRFEEAWELIARRQGELSPFVVSAFASALDLMCWDDEQKFHIPLVYPLSASLEPEPLLSGIRAGAKDGYRHFKVKTGRSLAADIATRQTLAGSEFEHFTFRYDANQAYGLEDARRFCDSREKAKNELWLEQPLDRHDWGGMEELCSKTSFPLMLDESIYTEEDISRAASIGCDAIKLKLAKHPGLKKTFELAEHANASGLLVTLGNGVSSEVGNWGELLVIAQKPALFVLGSECNGFLKLLSGNSGRLSFSEGCAWRKAPANAPDGHKC